MNEQLLAGKSILVLEDEYLIAMDVEQLCRDHGALDVLIAKNFEETEAIDSSAIDIAILDIMLGGVPTFDFARQLEAKRVPFIFATGYSDPQDLVQQFPHVQLVNKPYAGNDLLAALRQAMTSGKV